MFFPKLSAHLLLPLPAQMMERGTHFLKHPENGTLTIPIYSNSTSLKNKRFFLLLSKKVIK